MFRKLTERQRKAITALLSTNTLAEAAAVVGCGKRTLRRWLRTPSFLVRYERAAGHLHEAAMASLLAKTGLATEQLIALLGNEDPNVRVRAALGLIDRTVKSQEAVKSIRQIEKKINELEELLNGRDKNNAAAEAAAAARACGGRR